MPGRPSRRVVTLELAALAAALGVAVWRNGGSNWDLALFAILLVTSVVGDLPLDLDALRRSLQRLQGRAEDRVALAGVPGASRPLAARGRRFRVRRRPRSRVFSLRIHHLACECNHADDRTRPPRSRA